MASYPTDPSKVVKSGSTRTYGPVYQTVSDGVTTRNTVCLYRKWEVGKSRTIPRRYSYHLRTGEYHSSKLSNVSDAVQFCDAHYSDGYNQAIIQVTRNKRFARLVDKLYAGDSASMGAFFGEMKESTRMIAQRAEGLASGLRALRRRNVPEALSIWKREMQRKPRFKRIQNIYVEGRFRKEIWAEMPPFSPRGKKPHPKKRNKTFSELLLEVDYGWLPLVRDIFDFSAVLNGEAMPPFSVEATATGSSSYLADNWDSQNRVIATAKRIYTARCGGKFSVSNPWLHLAAKMGVVNPAAIVWELVPFTFFTDQFFNIGQMLDAPTQLAGLTVFEYYETDVMKIEGTYSREVYFDAKTYSASYRGVYIDRYPRSTPSLPQAAWRGNPYEENPRDPDSLSKILRKAVDHLAVCATLLSSAK